MTVIELIDANADKYPDKAALCDMDTPFTFREVQVKSGQATGKTLKNKRKGCSYV